MLDDVQAAPIAKLPVDEEWLIVRGRVGDVRVRIVQPAPRGCSRRAVHARRRGAGPSDTRDPRPARPRARGRRGGAVVFVEYDRSPEARYPVAIEQGYAVARWIVREGAANGLDAERLAVAGDSVGGNMTAALTLMATERGDVRFVHQSMYYPVTDAGHGHRLLRAVRRRSYLTAKAMAWFWDAYLPDLDRALGAPRVAAAGADEHLAVASRRRSSSSTRPTS